MAGLLARLPGAGLLREAWQATQLAGALAERKRQEKSVVLAEQRAALAAYKGENANKKLKELFEQEKYGEIAHLYFPDYVCSLVEDFAGLWWRVWDIYWIFVLLRILFVFFPQPGYVHPDEYFQTVEVIAGDVLGTDTVKTWEFNATTPLRSVTLNMILLGGPLYLARCLDFVVHFTTGWSLLGPYVVSLIPRLVMLVLSFVSDFAVYQICGLYKHSYNQCLTTLASSYVMLVYGIRTFSNSIEMAYMSLLLYMVAHCLKRTSETVYLQAMVHESYAKAETPKDRAQIHKKKKLIPPHDFTFFLPISILCAVGIFNRPTFVAFAAVPLFYWFQRGVATNSIVSPFQMFNFRMASLLPGFVVTSLLLILFDSLYYGELTLTNLWHLKMAWDDWKLTPLQFVMYNVVPGNLDKHGTHPHWLHALVNLQILYGPLGICALVSLVNFLAEIIANEWKNKPGVRTVLAMTMFTFTVALGLLSIFPHQEPRFLIPLTVPIVLMNAHRLRWKWGKRKPLLTLWYAFNIAATVFFGFVHQAGVTPAIGYISNEHAFQEGTSEANFVWSNTYMPTKYTLMQISHETRLWKSETGREPEDFPAYYLRPDVKINFEDMAGKSLEVDVKQKVITLATKARLRQRLSSKSRLENFVVLPTHIFDDLEEATRGHIKYTPVAYFFPHFSTENVPDLQRDLEDMAALLIDGHVADVAHGIVQAVGHFGLSLYSFELVEDVHTVELNQSKVGKSAS